jgi:hypothetical protein
MPLVRSRREVHVRGSRSWRRTLARYPDDRVRTASAPGAGLRAGAALHPQCEDGRPMSSGQTRPCGVDGPPTASDVSNWVSQQPAKETVRLRRPLAAAAPGAQGCCRPGQRNGLVSGLVTGRSPSKQQTAARAQRSGPGSGQSVPSSRLTARGHARNLIRVTHRGQRSGADVSPDRGAVLSICTCPERAVHTRICGRPQGSC